MTERCDCCELPVESCGKAAEARARKEARIARTRLLSRPGARAAMFRGSCGVCGEWYDAGAPIGPPAKPFTGSTAPSNR